MRKLFYLIPIIILFSCSNTNQNPRTIISLAKGWKFINSDIENAEQSDMETADWDTVTIPHDWAISGKFDENNDVFYFPETEDGKKAKAVMTGRTGGLPHVGVGWYRKALEVPDSWKNKKVFVEFDGAMSHAKVYLNGEFVGEWPYGYSSFSFDLTDKINFGGENILAVRLENKERASRWYPGAGLYRNVRLVITNPIHIKHLGTYITTPDLSAGKGTVNIATFIVGNGDEDENVVLCTEIIDEKGNLVVSTESDIKIEAEQTINQSLEAPAYQLWSIETPVLYRAVSKIMRNGKLIDEYETPFGFRWFEFTPDKGFFLNGQNRKLNGVCLHHDLGPLGTAVNKSAIKRQLTILQEMGCNAIRTSHNPPSPELLDLADEMGFLVIDEAFDEWKDGKCPNGYHTLWDEWAEKDLVTLIHRDRNHPSIILWSLGNEIFEQKYKEGAELGKFLVGICKREDPTRPTTAGFNHWSGAVNNGLADVVDVVGWNYQSDNYCTTHDEHPQWKMYASETVSTVSSRGEYYFPVEEKTQFKDRRPPYHCSSYDVEFMAGWGTSPDKEFAAQDSFRFIAGEFVWTGFDYLGEPAPYVKEWPSRSAYFGIIDLCGIPKDRYYLYQSKWTNKEVLHLLPHWNWKGREGEVIPVHCYTNFNKAELFLNGKSLGIREKDSSQLYTRYRLIWDVPYELGELKVVALDKNNQPLQETIMKTAGEPVAIRLEPMESTISSDGKELAFVTVSIADSNGNLCPQASNQINFEVEGEGKFKAVGNGDQTSLESFVKPTRKAFNGKCMVFIQSTEKPGSIKLIARSEGLEKAETIIKTR